MFLAQKLKLVDRTLRENCVTLKEVEKGNSNKDVATKNYVTKTSQSKFHDSVELVWILRVESQKYEEIKVVEKRQM